ncbi:heparinase II/III family protein [Prolixibacteraceae bacterium Z1-6]|uniref:Heparinase II/III family protein n=1 Tax=Draconibacterium aestuarii TaxID=2998507 RepID=A0A9X3F1V6_9BACT|nr:heparinase II/III family protein [Prolixibacteraceae bacterium Z1-6]
MKYIFGIILLSMSFFAYSCDKSDDPFSESELKKAGHPRILLLEGEEQQIQDLINSDETWQKMHEAILEKSNELLGTDVLERKMVGRRLLGTSREALKRIFYLAYAYRMTGYEKYLNRVQTEMVAVCGFSDWNPSHFLDVGEMTMAVAIGYDWLFADLSEDTRLAARQAILEKGLKASKTGEHWWINSENNWNQVCHAGMVYGALAVQEDYPDLAKEMIDRAFDKIPKAMNEYAPDGVYPEGYAYWGYGTSFNVLFLSAVEKIFNDDKGLTDLPGFLKTGDFMKHMLTPTGGSFTWSDSGTGTGLNPAMFWFAMRTVNPSVLWSEKRFLDTDDFDKFKSIRYLPALMIWGKNIPLSNITEPEEKMWVGQGRNPVAMMRSAWDTEAIYMGLKAGSPSVNHGHMDVGSFVMEADGKRWAADLGSQSYESLESLGMQIFGKTQDAERWTIFRMNNFSHNVLIVDDQHQRVDGYAKIDRYSDNENFMFSISDISTVYNGQLKSAKRGVAIKDLEYSIIRDEFETLDKTTKVRWQIVTASDVDLGEKQAILTQGGKQLTLKVQGSDNLEMRTWSTAPTTNYDAKNPGTIIVGFECEIPANTKAFFEVLMVPESSAAEGSFFNKTLEVW